ncbi:MAG TPA: LysE family translocator [Desulfobacterales bacterium]|nr:LysE family translocator [Desulfobacterales bacterium]HIP38611.1 LysE family translocator [Desulfocapsa sulfexigens]
MPGVTDLGLFIIAGLILNITPGVDLLFITNRSVVQGKKAGVIAALGIGAGCIVHVLAATLGLSMILVSSSLAFTFIKFLGAAYLIYLGITTLLNLKKNSNCSTLSSSKLSHGKIFRHAILVNVLNPKVALFFMALLPQFVSPGTEHPALAFLFLGLVFNVNGVLVNVMFAIFASALAARIKSTTMLSRCLKSLVGTLFIVLGIRLGLTS